LLFQICRIEIYRLLLDMRQGQRNDDGFTNILFAID
jgi:hypothetical protein